MQSAAVLHDLAKINAFFQAKVTSNKAVADPFRHELLSALVCHDLAKQRRADAAHGLPKRLAVEESLAAQLHELVRTMDSRGNLSPLHFLEVPGKPWSYQDLVEWLVVTHHRLPQAGRGCAHHVSVFNRDRPWQEEQLVACTTAKVCHAA